MQGSRNYNAFLFFVFQIFYALNFHFLVESLLLRPLTWRNISLQSQIRASIINTEFLYNYLFPINWGTRVHHPFFQDLPATLRRMSDFLERDLSEDVIQKIAQHCSFKAMKDNQMSNFKLVPRELMDSEISPFLRKGELLAFSCSDESCWCWYFIKSGMWALEFGSIFWSIFIHFE